MEEVAQWKNKAEDNFVQVQALCGWVEKEILEVQQETVVINEERAGVRAEVKELRSKILHEQKEQQLDDCWEISEEVQKLKKLKQENSQQIQQLKRALDQKKLTCLNYQSKITQNNTLSSLFDSHLKTYTTLHQIQTLLTSKGKLMSSLLSQLNEVKSLSK